MIKKIYSFLILLAPFLTMSIVSGCVGVKPIPPQPPTSTPTRQQETPINTLMPSPIPTNTIVFPPTPFIPTPSEEQVDALFDALGDETCFPPCYLGIIPGETRFEEANYKLLELGARIGLHPATYEYKGDVMYKYNYVARHYLPEGYISQVVSLFVYKGYVFRMDVSLNSSVDGLLLEDWGKYSTSYLLNQYGIPDIVFVSPYVELSEVWLLYVDQGVFIKNQCLSKDNSIVCPELQIDESSSIHMLFFAPEHKNWLIASSQTDSIIVFEFGNDGIKFAEDWMPIETVLGISPAQFYEQMMNNPKTCFKRADYELP